MTGSDRSADRLRATDLSRFTQPVNGQHPSLIGGLVRTLVWRLIDGQEQIVAAELISDSAIGVSDLMDGLTEFGIRLDPDGNYHLSHQRERLLCADIGRMLLLELQTATYPRIDIPNLSESEAADLTVDMLEARLYGRDVTSPVATQVRAVIEETYGSLTHGMADWLEDIALAQWCWRQIGAGLAPSDLTRVLARAGDASADKQIRESTEVTAELRRIAGLPAPAEDNDRPF